ESKFGRRIADRGHRVEGVWIVGMVERSAAKRILLFEVENRKKKTLHELIQKHVVKGSTIDTNCWTA
ncbi:hypothetical protein COBT_001772, partial [Conglomerata obtusa]